MPCRDYDDVTPTELMKFTLKPSLLCEACELLEQHGLLNHASQDLKNWFQLHENAEADRVRLEAAQKLTERELRLLNIDIEYLRSKVK